MKLSRLSSPLLLFEFLDGDSARKNLIIDSIQLPFNNLVNELLSRSPSNNIFVIDFRKAYSNKMKITLNEVMDSTILFPKIIEAIEETKYKHIVFLNIDYLLLYNSLNFIRTITKYIEKIHEIVRRETGTPTIITVSISITSKKLFMEDTVFPIIFDNIIEFLSPTEFIVHRHVNIDISGRKFFSHYKDFNIYKHLVFEDGLLYYFNIRSEINDEFSEKALYETIFELLPSHMIEEFFKRWAEKYLSNVKQPSNLPLEDIVKNMINGTREIGGGKLTAKSITENKIIIEGTDLFPKKIDNYKGPIHYLYLYTMIEILKRSTGDKWIGKEVTCENIGHNKCTFVLERVS